MSTYCVSEGVLVLWLIEWIRKMSGIQQSSHPSGKDKYLHVHL